MNYRNLIKSQFQTKQDHHLTAVALLAGIAVGAVIAALFANRPGRETRKLLAEKFSAKHPEEHYLEIKNHLIDDLRETTREHAEKLKGRSKKNESKDPIAIKVSSAGTDAWKKSADEHQEKQPWKE